MKNIRSYRDLDVYKAAFAAAMTVFESSKRFPDAEKYSLTDQIRKSSRSVCSSIAEARRKRRYRAHFVSKLSDAEMEAEETRVWLEFASSCGYLGADCTRTLDCEYDRVLRQLVVMIRQADNWTIQ